MIVFSFGSEVVSRPLESNVKDREVLPNLSLRSRLDCGDIVVGKRVDMKSVARKVFGKVTPEESIGRSFCRKRLITLVSIAVVELSGK